jgi:hypothetical protein
VRTSLPVVYTRGPWSVRPSDDDVVFVFSKLNVPYVYAIFTGDIYFLLSAAGSTVAGSTFAASAFRDAACLPSWKLFALSQKPIR